MSVKRLKRRAKQVLPVGVSVFILDTLAGDLPLQRTLSGAVKRTAGRLAHGQDAPVAGSAIRPLRAVVVDRFDSWAERERALEHATLALGAAGVPYALLPKRYGAKTVVMRGDDKMRAIAALLRNSTEQDAWHLTPIRRGRPSTKRTFELRLPGAEETETPVEVPGKRDRQAVAKHSEFVLFNHTVSPAGEVFGSPRYGVTLSFWAAQPDGETPRADGYTYEPATLMAPSENGTAAYLSPEAWDRAIASPTRWPLDVSHPHIYQITEPVDVVYTWVDGDDPEWQRRKAEALGMIDAADLNSTAANVSRYTSRDELRYSLRSLEMYANWVRNIYIVTDDQVPAWLDVSNPRIKVVSHREIFADPGLLPVFNSHAIESQLHRIIGLSNHFLYMNDDVLFGQQVQPADFFLSDRISKYFPSKACLDVDPPSARDLPVLSAAKNARRLIAEEFGVTITNKFKHTPMALQRDVLAEMEGRFPGLFAEVAASRFRHPDDFSIPSGLYHYYAFTQGRAVPGSISYGYQDISRPDLPIFLARLAGNHPYRVFCLNDTDSTPEQIAATAEMITRTMQKCYPFRSSFERADQV